MWHRMIDDKLAMQKIRIKQLKNENSSVFEYLNSVQKASGIYDFVFLYMGFYNDIEPFNSIYALRKRM